MTKFNKLLLGAVALYAFSPLTFSNGEEGKAYISGSVGLSMPAKKFDYDAEDNNMHFDPVKLKNSMNFGAAVGYKLSDNFRTELAFNHFNNFKFHANDKSGDSTYKQKISSTSAFINGYYDIKEINGFMPYITAGFSFSENKAGDFIVHPNAGEPVSNPKGKTQTEFGWNAGLGVAYNINEKITLDLINYKYYDLGKLTTGKDDDGDAYGGKLRVHSLNTGIRIKF